MKEINGKWLVQKLAQNGFSLEDLADQTGIDLAQLQAVADHSQASQDVWDVILDTLNQYPRVTVPSASVLDDLQQDIAKYGGDAPCLVFYGVNQNELAFCEYKPLEDLSMHGGNVPTDYLAQMQITLQEALQLFTKQNYSAQTYTEE